MRTAADYAAGVIMTPRRHQADEWEESVATTATEHELPSGNMASTWGTSGPAVLLVHGWEGRSTQFAELIRVIVANGWQAVAVDAPGHGRSPDGDYTPVRHGEAILEVLPHYAPFDAVVTHSFGSTATFFAMRRGLAVRRMALISPLVSLSGRLTDAAEQLGMRSDQRKVFMAAVQERLGIPPEELDIDALPEPNAPVLVCHDLHDREISVDTSRLLAKRWPHTTLVETTGLHHRRILTAPDVVRTVADHIGCVTPTS